MAISGRHALGQLGVTLIVRDVEAAADFYRDVLGAREIQRNYAFHPGGPRTDQAVSAEMELGGAYLVVASENTRFGEAPRSGWPRSPTSAGGATACLAIYVDDVDDVFTRAIAAGASPQVENHFPEDTFWGDRIAQLHDPFGHVWRIQTKIEDVDENELGARFLAVREAYRARRGATPKPPTR